MLLLLLLLSNFSRVRLWVTPETLGSQPTRLPHPWDSPGKNPGVGCHFLLHKYTGDTIFTAESEYKLKSLLKVKEESEKVMKILV